MNMSKTTKGILDVVLYLIVFIVVQFVVTIVGGAAWAAAYKQDFSEVSNALGRGENAPLLAMTSIFSNVITFMVFLRAKWTPVSRVYLASKPWFSLFWVVMFTLGIVLPLEFIYEQLGVELDSQQEQVLASLLKEPWGYVAVGIFAPLVEEVVFRGAILRTLLGMMDRKRHWIAILVSACMFGVAHGNLAQFLNATLMGLVLGWMYYRTGSVIPGILLHWVNNSLAYVLVNLLPQHSDQLIDLFGGNEQTVYLAVLFSLCIAVPSLLQLTMRLKRVSE